ncbi:hypothetical protein ABZZ74_33490 [Streptomyces sp. NPDC006476]|uniref:hypothetical protein n=1 Tax=Streptomyces sp. NPDC006476 TaxID=3157175 RepID=UPI0033ABBA87
MGSGGEEVAAGKGSEGPEQADTPRSQETSGAGTAVSAESAARCEPGADPAPAGAEATAAGSPTPEDASDELPSETAPLGAASGSGGGSERHRAAPPAEVPGPHEAGDAPRTSRRRSPVLIASVAAAVFLVGGGGAYLAASASDGSGGRTGAGASGDDTPPPLALDGYGSGGTNGIAPGEPNPYGVTYRADGSLPDGPDSAPVYRVTGDVTKDQVARLAKALGLQGTPVAQGQAWQVGPDKDGSGPSLVVNRQTPGTWTFHRYAAGADACQSVTVCTSKDPANPAVDTIGVAAAEKAAAPVLKAVGQDDAKVDASQVMGAQRVVNADPVVGGLPTYGRTTGLTIGAQGEVVGGSGQLSTPVKGDTYPVLGARRTLDLLNAAPRTDHRMGIGGCASPVPLKDRLEAPCGQSTSAATASPAQNAATVEHAVLGLASHTVGGRPALVPSWLFQVRAAGAQNTFTVTYPAIDPKYLVSDSPSAQPTPSGTEAPDTRDVKVDSYLATGTTLTVSFTGGVCGDYDAKATESSDEVTVTVTETPWKDKVCIMIAKEMTRIVHLDEPLGDRKVVGSDGKEIPQVKPGARLPRTSAGVR